MKTYPAVGDEEMMLQIELKDVCKASKYSISAIGWYELLVLESRDFSLEVIIQFRKYAVFSEDFREVSLQQSDRSFDTYHTKESIQLIDFFVSDHHLWKVHRADCEK